MADEVQDAKIPYEILVRFDRNGAPIGAHACYLRRITLNGEIVKEEIGEAMPIDVAGFPASAIMSETTLAALARVTVLQAAVTRLQAENSDLRREIDEGEI